jgi:hypothetical protein
MQFDYRKKEISLNPAHPHILVPEIQILLSAGNKGVKLWALIDSGAATSLFHSSLATAMGIDLTSGLREDFFGISGEPVSGYFHNIRIQLIGANHFIEVAAAFTDSPGVFALLGQADFFQAYQVKFERYKERVEIKPAPKK